ncbi:aspartic peptidase domain-containing protein [Leptodontidium sp. MPI-SDFR-AT-0119]|nr:aspartic peptidase domain-containing protein [Leptodontidium sp. MPI-SDFR-AT-0119]
MSGLANLGWTCIIVFISLALPTSTLAREVAYAPSSRKFIPGSQRHNASFSLTQIRNPKWKPRETSTTAVYAAEFLKHKVHMPEDLRIAWEELKLHDDQSSNSSIHPRVGGQLVRYSDGQYVFPVTIGTPKQTLNLIFDTASGDFWVWSWLMPIDMLQNRKYYNGSASSDATPWDGQSWGATYAVGSNYGIVWQDVVWIDAIGVAGNPIECSQGVSNWFASLPGVDGVLGLSYAYNDSEKPEPQQTWTTYILPLLAAPVFTASLVRNGIGIIDFGFIDQKKYIGSIAYTPITIIPGGGAFWAFNWTGFAIGSDKFNRTNIQVMTDTGGNISMMPESIASRYYKLVAGSYKQVDGTWIFPCKATLPNFVFGVGSSRIVVTGKNFILTNLPDGINCIGGIQSREEDTYVFLSIPFMQSIFVVHDYGNMRMGFANRTWV